ncbi:MAG: RecX family transcriptional regulator [Deltaproteobacteria bacterium]|nr:RecX family transcriptional regulator [Deltaproteobacteria bacterium]
MPFKPSKRTPGDKASAVNVGLRIMSRRAHTRAELAKKLALRGFDEHEVGQAIDRLKDLNALDDDDVAATRVAEALARDVRMTPRVAQAKLEQRGIPREVAHSAVSAAFSAWSPKDAALAYVRGETDAHRAARRLAQRGFPTDTILWVVRHLSKSDL